MFLDFFNQICIITYAYLFQSDVWIMLSESWQNISHNKIRCLQLYMYIPCDLIFKISMKIAITNSIIGSYSNIIGIPMYWKVVQVMCEFNIIHTHLCQNQNCV